jgi:predicted nucleic acid-binding Zn ribbon protein
MADEQQRKKNVRLALILASVVVALFFGFMAKTLLMGR